MKNPRKKRTPPRVTSEPPANHSAAIGGQKPNHLLPVLRTKQADWCIPRINEQEVRLAKQRELERLRELFRGTTPAGRELYRKICCGISSILRRNFRAYEEAIAYARSEFKTFPGLESEFKQQFLIGHGKEPDLDSVTLDGMAISLVIVEKARLAVFGCG